jgi:hypothetical protein
MEINLKGYLANEGISLAAFAAKLQCSISHLAGVICGSAVCGKRLARDIEKATAGIVKAENICKKRKRVIKK